MGRRGGFFHRQPASDMQAVTFSYGGGVNSNGTTIAQGGFEPYLSLFELEWKLSSFDVFCNNLPFRRKNEYR